MTSSVTSPVDDYGPDIAMTNRQLAGAVRFSRKVQFFAPDVQDTPIVGYVMGFDDLNVRVAEVVDNSIENWILNRQDIAAMKFSSVSTMKDEKLRDRLEDLVRGARSAIVDEYFPDRPHS